MNICKRCNKDITKNAKCFYHNGHYNNYYYYENGIKSRWSCCKQKKVNDPGCKFAYHYDNGSDSEIEEEYEESSNIFQYIYCCFK
jgi:hypothetical protein